MSQSKFTPAEGCLAVLIICSVQAALFVVAVWLAAQIFKHVFLG